MDGTISILVVSRLDEDRKRIIDILSEQKEYFIVGEEKDEAGAVIRSERLKPDIIIIDLQLTSKDGAGLVSIIRRKTPSSAIILLCDNDEDNYVCLALKAGSAGFLIKETDINNLALIVKIIYLNGCYISASIIFRVFSTVTFMSQFPMQITEDNHITFTLAERGIVTDIAQGLSDDQIARHLHFSAGTIKNYVTAIKRKTKLKNRMQIVIYSLVFGLINFDYLWFRKIIDNKT